MLFDRSGEVVLEHRTPDRTYELGRITVGEGTPTPAAGAFDTLRRAPELEAERAGCSTTSSEPDKTLALVAEMDMVATPRTCVRRGATFACPMDHPGREPEPDAARSAA